MLRNFKRDVSIAIDAHSEEFVEEKANAYRYETKKIPYAIHPIWCAMTILTETKLPVSLRETGYQVLLFHDILEDTNYQIKDYVSEDIYSLIEEMTFLSFRDEQEKIKYSSDFIKLLKLYDKTSNLLDGSWMSAKREMTYVEYTQNLSETVKEVYGELNITIISKNICDEILCQR